MNAVKSDTRAACCMLCVTIRIVTRWRSSVISSSIFAVAIGSSAEVGSSNSRISGSRRERARDAEPLHLSAGQRQRRNRSGDP